MTERGIVLWLPGGGWRGWSDEDGAALAGHGLTVVQGRYRLSTEATWPAQLDDVRAAAREPLARARSAGLPFLVAGDSAGGHLALHLGLRGVTEPGDVDGVLAFWSPVDPLDEEWLRARGDDNPWVALLGHRPAAGDPATVDVIPSSHVGNSRVPVLLVHGVADAAVPVGQAVALTSTLLRAGHPVHSLVTHGGHALPLDRPDIHAVTAAFLGANLPG
ncbi:alpha/beta hydrolase [Micromonospora sp. WMMD1102]|uniref:alpha/beta hydrolase n=1 Tax=Micromonospora sp. WMMD1102 TaxID=3016105 RepID=UPI0024156C8E|nr:alpha/beta hydrolase [Micromonospora sp. WMMD1102]MDG4789454.1 alpha/beta hydrolase [Micromonospora sp. WMMD1102]